VDAISVVNVLRAAPVLVVVPGLPGQKDLCGHSRPVGRKLGTAIAVRARTRTHVRVRARGWSSARGACVPTRASCL